MSTPQYTTAKRLNRRVSKLGVDLRTDHEPNEADDGKDANGALGECIDSASSEVAGLCWRYDPTALTQSDWIATLTTDIAVFYLCELRLDSVPKAVEKAYDRAMEQLTKIQDGKAPIPGIAMGRGAAPVLSNFRIDLARHPGVRVDRSRSTGSTDGYKRRTDPNSEMMDTG